MRITMPEHPGVLRIGTTDPAAGIPTRMDLSTRLGLDIGLVLGPIGAEDELDEYTRLCALVDMADSGIIPRGASLDLLAGIAEDIEREDDEGGFEPEDAAAEWGWAA